MTRVATATTHIKRKRSLRSLKRTRKTRSQRRIRKRKKTKKHLSEQSCRTKKTDLMRLETKTGLNAGYPLRETHGREDLTLTSSSTFYRNVRSCPPGRQDNKYLTLSTSTKS